MVRHRTHGHPSLHLQKLNRSRHRAPYREEQGPLSHPVLAVLALQQTVGNRVTRALIQRQNSQGSATVVGSSSGQEKAEDVASYTQELTSEIESDKTPTEQELTETLEKKALSAHRFESQHPNLAQMGIRPKEIKGNKLGVYIGNNNYKNNPPYEPLPGATADAERMKGAMEGHDYKAIGHHQDKNAKEINSIYGGAIGKARSGDALLLYYGGHGTAEAMAGISSYQKEFEPSGAGAQEEGSEGRGAELVTGLPPELGAEGEAQKDQLTDMAYYSQMMNTLEIGVAKGVHTIFRMRATAARPPTLFGIRRWRSWPKQIIKKSKQPLSRSNV